MSLNHQFFHVKHNIKIKENLTSSTALSKSKTTDVIFHGNESRFRCISLAVFIGTICTHSCIRLQQREFLPLQVFILNLPWGFPDRNVAFEPLKVGEKRILFSPKEQCSSGKQPDTLFMIQNYCTIVSFLYTVAFATLL